MRNWQEKKRGILEESTRWELEAREKGWRPNLKSWAAKKRDSARVLGGNRCVGRTRADRAHSSHPDFLLMKTARAPIPIIIIL